MLSFNPNDRPSLDDALAHCWTRKDIDEEQIRQQIALNLSQKPARQKPWHERVIHSRQSETTLQN